MAEIRKIMTENVIVVSQSASIKNAAKLMKSKSVSSLVVIDKGKPVAVVSENDIIAGISSKKNKVKDIIKKDFIVYCLLFVVCCASNAGIQAWSPFRFRNR